MKREITIDSVSFSTLIPGMQSGRYDFIAAPTTVTKERAENMLFTAGYLWTAFQFGIKKGSRADQGLGGSQGQGGVGQQGHALRDARQADGRGARLRRCRSTTPSPTPRRPCCRAAPTRRSAATPRSSTPPRKNPQFVADLELKETRAHWAAPVPKDNPKLRAQLQDALDCMKKDGTHRQALREVVRQEAGAGRSRRGDHAGLRRAGHAGLRSDAARAEVRLMTGASEFADRRSPAHPQAFRRPSRPEGRRSGGGRARAGVRDRAVGLGQVDPAALPQPAGGAELGLDRGRRHRHARARRPTSTMPASASAWCSSRSTSIRT